ncbi:hypothetical protein PanWU01x14_139240 [Parasponia andersonii]|uniref:RNase H type-1 domain-containing protein n=1 Tax=Parasponia andersonii TaxID=3476 RepID=A0A2P5CMX6_PARAD|nr:hypothetical protein PanWU01x14_139240 [Parasponia andersonii]
MDSIASALARKDRGEVILAITNIVNFIEAATLLARIRVAMDKGIKYVIFDCDCASVVHGIQGSLETV